MEKASQYLFAHYILGDQCLLAWRLVWKDLAPKPGFQVNICFLEQIS